MANNMNYLEPVRLTEPTSFSDLAAQFGLKDTKIFADVSKLVGTFEFEGVDVLIIVHLSCGRTIEAATKVKLYAMSVWPEEEKDLYNALTAGTGALEDETGTYLFPLVVEADPDDDAAITTEIGEYFGELMLRPGIKVTIVTLRGESGGWPDIRVSGCRNDIYEYMRARMYTVNKRDAAEFDAVFLVSDDS